MINLFKSKPRDAQKGQILKILKDAEAVYNKQPNYDYSKVGWNFDIYIQGVDDGREYMLKRLIKLIEEEFKD